MMKAKGKSKGNQQRNVGVTGIELRRLLFDIVDYSRDAYTYLHSLRPGQRVSSLGPQPSMSGVNIMGEQGQRKRGSKRSRDNLVVTCWKCKRSFKSVRGLRLHQRYKGCTREM